jgi:hypothetical protein
MNATVHSSERNGYKMYVYQYTAKGQTRYMANIVNLTTGNSEQTPGWSSYRTALEVAQQSADEAKI